MPRLLRHLTLLLGLTLLSASPEAMAQKTNHSPKKAGILSACVPGLGQIYNGKWWKTPIVYAGFGGLGYMAYNNYNNYKTYLTAYEIKTGDLPDDATPSEIAVQLSQSYQASQLQTYKESFRRDFELYCIIMVAWYGLNIVDAIVDGHLYTYDISDDLSLAVDPVFIAAPNALYLKNTPPTGLTLSLNF